MTRRRSSGARCRASATTGSSASRARTTSGAWAIPGRAAPARRSSTTTVRRYLVARPARRTRTATGSSSCGTWCSCSTEEGPPGTRIALPRPSIDTGMGLERCAAILQGKHDNYDTDVFRALILASAEATGQDPDGPFRASHRVVADHLRSVAFLIADGVLPLNEGRGYVLRRIMRRAMRHAHMMGAREPLMHRLVPVLVRQMGAAYPELVRAEALIIETLLLEETQFRRTLDRGLHLLTEETARLGRPPASARRGGVPAVRHVRLPARSHAGRTARAGARGGPRRVRGCDGRTARACARRLGRYRRGRHRARLVRAEGAGRRIGVPRLLDRDR